MDRKTRLRAEMKIYRGGLAVGEAKLLADMAEFAVDNGFLEESDEDEMEAFNQLFDTGEE